MAAPVYPSIPVPTADPAALYQSVLALKTAVDTLTGGIGSGSASAVNPAYVASAIAKAAYVPPAAVVMGQCTLALSGSNIVLSPKYGNLLTINGVNCIVPAAGVSLAPTGLTAGTLYYIYAVASGTSVGSLEASTTTHATSATAGNVGVEIKSGDDTRTLVGLVRPIAGPAFSDLITQRFVVSWFNPKQLSLNNKFTAVRTTTNTTTWDELNTEIRCEFLVLHPTRIVDFSFSGYAFSSSTFYFLGAVGFDGTSPSPNADTYSAGYGNTGCDLSVRAISVLAEGYHYATALGSTTGGTASFPGGGTKNGRNILTGAVWG